MKYRALALQFLLLGSITAFAEVAPAQVPPDLLDMLPIFEDNFEAELDRYDGKRGLWTTLPRRERLMTNSAASVFIDRGVLPPAAEADLPDVHVATEDGLSLRTVVLPPAAHAAVTARMRSDGQGNRAGPVRYAVGMISTSQTWSQTYGWFEIEARIPRGRGRWPAFWATFAGPGWPPEINIAEAFGEGIAAPARRDGMVNSSVRFDAFDHTGAEVHSVDIVNQFDGKAAPRVDVRGGRNVYTFHRRQIPDGNIFDRFNIYAAFWTPEDIRYYFGPDRASLREVYRVPTPDDAHVPLYILANDQFTARGGWLPPDDDLAATLDPFNDFRIRRITVRALEPELRIELSANDPAYNARSSVVYDTAGDDVIAPGGGFDVIRLSGGADTLRLTRGPDNKIIEGFGPDDRLVLDGYPFADSTDALSRLTQVGADVWLPSGADPFWPHTIVLRDLRIADVTTEQIVLRWPIGRDIWAAAARGRKAPQTEPDGTGTLTAPDTGGWLSDAGTARRLVGGPGPDRFFVSKDATHIDEAANGGVDTLVAWGSRTLPRHVEHGILRGQGGRLRGTEGNDRLEVEGTDGTLSGGAGDDLFVIAPAARGATLVLDDLPGHDVIRGWGPGHRVRLAPGLRARAEAWRLTDSPEGGHVDFGNGRSVLVEGLTGAELETLLAP